MRGTWRLGAVAAVIASSLSFAATAGGNAVGPGKTVLEANQQTFEALTDMGIEVDTTGQAKFTRRGTRFPVRGGDISPQDGFKGLVGHGGGLMLSRASDGATIKFSKLAIAIGSRKAKVYARLNRGHTTVRLMTFSGGDRVGTDTSFQLKDAKATLAGEAADLLSQTFDFPFRKDIVLGTTTTKATVDDSPSERF